MQVEREDTDGRGAEVLYTRRVRARAFRPPVFLAGGRYTVRADPDGPAAGGSWAWTRAGVVPGEGALAVDP